MGPNERSIRQGYAYFASGDFQALFELLAEDCVFKAAGARNRIEHAGRWVGLDGALLVLSKILNHWTFDKVEVLEVITADDRRFVVRTAVAGAHRRTGSPVSLERIDWITMQDGKCKSCAETLDTSLLERAARPR